MLIIIELAVGTKGAGRIQLIRYKTKNPFDFSPLYLPNGHMVARILGIKSKTCFEKGVWSRIQWTNMVWPRFEKNNPPPKVITANKPGDRCTHPKPIMYKYVFKKKKKTDSFCFRGSYICFRFFRGNIIQGSRPFLNQ